MNYQDYIKTELLILVPVLYLVGVGLKKSKLPDKWIPATLGAVSITLSAVWVIATSDLSGISQIASAFFTAVIPPGHSCRHTHPGSRIGCCRCTPVGSAHRPR